MDHRKAEEGTKVRVTKDIDQASAGTEGTIIYLRGYNREIGGKILGRYVQVWIKKDLPACGRVPARKTEYSITATTQVLEIVK